MMLVHHEIAVSDHINAVAAMIATPALTERAVLRCTTSSIELRALLGGPSQVDQLVLDLATNLDPFPPSRDARRNRQASSGKDQH